MRVLIVANAIYLGFDIDLNDGTRVLDTSWFFIIMDNIFCTVFFLEILIRFAAFRIKRHCLLDHWFKFDLFLACFMVLETWILAFVASISSVDQVNLNFGPLRFLRLLRLTRMTRLIQSMPELVSMTYGLLAGMRACFSALVLNGILVYTFACGMVIFLKHEAEANEAIKQVSESIDVHCERLGNCMWLLMIDGTFLLDGTGLVLSSLVFGDNFSTCLAGLMLLIFILISALVICNMLIGVLCEVVSTTTAEQRSKHDKARLKDSMLTHLAKFDNGDGMLSNEELLQVMNEPESRSVLMELNVDRTFVLALMKMFSFEDDAGLPIPVIFEMLLASRADNHATVQTIASFLSYVTFRLEQLGEYLASQMQHSIEHSGGRERVEHIEV
jgi:hypothetical protein